MTSARLPIREAQDIEENDLRYFCEMIEGLAGIALKPAKHELLKTRLRARLDAHGLSDYREYRRLLESLGRQDPEWQAFTNMLTTNKTDFFREPAHFQYLKNELIPAWLKGSATTFRVWCAASSTGEEPYTLAMVLQRCLPPGRDFSILATDIDTEVLAAGKNAVYAIAKKTEIPAEYQNCIEVGKNEARGWFRIKRAVKEKVTFSQHNLVGRNLPVENGFDMIICRNVLIYFGPDNIALVQAKLHSAAKTGGHLFIGHSESFQGIPHPWRMVAPSVFRKTKAGGEK